MKTKSLFTKVAISTMAGVAVIIAIIYLAYLSQKDFEETVVSQTQQQMLSTVKSAAHGLGDFIQSIQRELRNGARVRQIQNTAQNSILEDEAHEKEYHAFKAIFDGFDAKIDSFYLLDANGIILDRVPFKKERIGVSYLHKPGVEYVSREHKPYVSEIFKTTSGVPAVSILHPILKDNEFAGIMRAIIHIETFNKHFMQPVKIGKDGYLILLDDDGTIYHHPSDELIGKNIGPLQKEKLGGEEEKEREAVKNILSGSEGWRHLVFDEFSPHPQCIAWTYVSTDPIASGAAGLKIRYDNDVPRYKLEKKARIIALELDGAIPRLENLTDTGHLSNILKDLQAKYPDIVEITIHGPRSAQDKTLIYKVSTSPGLEGKLSDPEDVQAVKDDTFNVQFRKQKQGRPHAGEDVIDVTAPIHTDKEIWPLVAVQPYSEISGPINRHAWNTSGLAGLVILLFGGIGIGVGAYVIRSQRESADAKAEAKYFKQLANGAEALRESEQRHRKLFEEARDGIFVAEAETGVIIDCNRAAAELVGREKSELIGQHQTMLHPPHQVNEEFSETFQKHLGDSEGYVLETQVITSTGEIKEVAIKANLIHIGDRKLIQGIFRDTTERKRAEEALRERTEALERSNKELEQFAYVASHDLQEPLRMVASYTQLLAKRYKGKLDSDADEFIAYAVDGATRMQALINDLLTYSRVGTKGKDFKPIDCKTVLERTLDNLKQALEESGAEVTYEPLPTVVADDMQLGQLFQNLIGNAIRFRSKEPPHVHVSAEQNEDKWIFSVRDNGIGIDPEFHERIFIIFQRLHKMRDYPGTGIGLAVCKKIVERHGGRIWVESSPEKGSTFYFTIPLRGGISHE